MHTYIHAYKHTSVHACIHTHLHVPELTMTTGAPVPDDSQRTVPPLYLNVLMWTDSGNGRLSGLLHQRLHTHAHMLSVRIRFLYMLACACVRSKAWLAAHVSLQQARMPRTARARCSCRLRATLVAAPVLFAHAFGPCYMGKTYRNGRKQTNNCYVN